MISLTTGVILGAISWAVVPLVSNEIEPFDSGLGLLIGQIIMSTAAFYFALSKGSKTVLLYLLGIYIGMNGYAYAVGTPGTRLWAGLLLVTSIALCVIPAISAGAGKLTGIFRRRRQNNIE